MCLLILLLRHDDGLLCLRLLLRLSLLLLLLLLRLLLRLLQQPRRLRLEGLVLSLLLLLTTHHGAQTRHSNLLLLLGSRRRSPAPLLVVPRRDLRRELGEKSRCGVVRAGCSAGLPPCGGGGGRCRGRTRNRDYGVLKSDPVAFLES